MAKQPAKNSTPKASSGGAKAKKVTDVKPAGKQPKKAKVFEPGVEG